MTLREQVLNAVEEVPSNKLSVLLHFARFLRDCPLSLGETEEPIGRPSDLWGIFAKDEDTPKSEKKDVEEEEEIDYVTEGFELLFESEYRKLLKAQQELQEMKKQAERRQGGWVKGKIWISDDSLEFVSDDEIKILEAIRNNKKEPQEVAV